MTEEDGTIDAEELASLASCLDLHPAAPHLDLPDRLDVDAEVLGERGLRDAAAKPDLSENDVDGTGINCARH